MQNSEHPFIKKNFYGKIILITGGTGSIGSEIVRQLIHCNPKQLRIFSRDETKQSQLQRELEPMEAVCDLRYLIGDIRDKDRLGVALDRVDIVFHAAAMKHVPYCEYNPFEAVKTNVTGTQNLIQMSIDQGVEKLIAISTDKAVNPNTVMGMTKLLMERMIISSKAYIGLRKTMMSVVRFGNVLHSRGSVIPTWLEQIKNGGPVTVTNKEMRRYFMTIPEAVNMVLEAGSMMVGQEIFILKMKEFNIYEMAQELIRKYGNGQDIPIQITGSREREKITELLYTDEEKKTMIDMGEYYIILPNEKILSERKQMYMPLTPQTVPSQQNIVFSQHV